MSDERIIEYLRSRGHAEPPSGLVHQIMGTIDEVPASASRFTTFLPAAALAGALAIWALIALMMGLGRDVGPAPGASTSTPTAPERVSVDELRSAVVDATERLASAGSVFGVHRYEIGGYLASATWFDWRPNGDQIVVTRSDVDVSALWWLEPGGEPLSTGVRIEEVIDIVAGGSWYRSTDGAWEIADREEAPRILTWSTAVLSGDIPPIGELDVRGDLLTTYRQLADGGETWTLESGSDDEPQLVEWTVDADGLLARYRGEGIGLSIASQAGLLVPVHSRVVIDFSWGADVGAIPEPDPDARPEVPYALPADFPLDPDAALPIGGLDVDARPGSVADGMPGVIGPVVGVMSGTRWRRPRTTSPSMGR